MAEYEAKLYQVQEIPGADSLIAGGAVEVGVVKITTPGEYKRGEVLMSSGDSFVKVTAGGITTAEELCIMCNDVTLEDGDEGEFWVYLRGRFNWLSLVVEEAIDLTTAENAMRKHGMYIG